MLIINFIKKIFNWLFLLFSDSQFASTRRVIGVTAFVVNTIALPIVLFFQIRNEKLVMELLYYNFITIMTIVVGANVTDVVKFAYNRIPFLNREVDNSQEENINS